MPNAKATSKSVLDSLLPSLNGNGAMFLYHGERFSEQGKASGSCEKLLDGYTLLLMAFNEEAEGAVRPTWPYGTKCTRSGLHWLRAEAVCAFNVGQYNEAIGWYQKALATTDDPELLGSLQQGIGTSHMYLNDLEKAHAWYVKSLANGEEMLSSISLSNMANLALMLAHNEDAKIWSEMAEDRLLSEFKEGMSAPEFEKRMDLVLLNQMLAAIELDDLDAAHSLFNRMTLDDFFPGLGVSYFHAALTLAWRSNDPVPLALHESQFSRALLEDSAGAVGYFGPVLALLPPWRTEICSDEAMDCRAAIWAQVRSLPETALPPLPDPERMAKSSLPWSPVRWGWGLSGLILFIGTATTIRNELLLRNDPDEALQGPYDRDKAMMAVEQALHNPIQENRIEAKRNLKMLTKDLEQATQLPIPEQVSEREKEVFFAALHGERPKLTAQRLGISLNRVYAIRSELRTKMAIPLETDFVTWLEQLQNSNRP